jgi:hypothetical protein
MKGEPPSGKGDRALRDTEIIGPPKKWPAVVTTKQDRWTIRIPAGTMRTRQKATYYEQNTDENGQHLDAPADWTGQSFGDYVRVSIEPRPERNGAVVLRVDLVEESTLPTVTLPEAALGKFAGSVEIASASQKEFKKVQARTAAARLRQSAVAAGVIGGPINFSFALGKATGNVAFHFSSSAESILLVFAAVLTILAPVAVYLASSRYAD